MDYDNNNLEEIQPSSAVSKISDNTTSVVRQRSRGASARNRHTSPATYQEEHSRSADDLPPSSTRSSRPEDIAGLGISHAFREFTLASDVIPDEPFAVLASKEPPKSVLVASERLGLFPCQPPNVMRSISDESTSSSQSAGSVILATVDTGHNGLIASIGTTNKFTQKWPTPKSLSYGSHLKQFKDVRSTGLRPNHSPTSALEDGQGIASGHVARWTSFKWCLLFSVMTVFTYGTAGLIYALMTWFNS